jgi:predicted nucleic acid-binding protein
LSLVVADTSPLNYLVLLGHAELLPRLFDRIIIPERVADELRHRNAPEGVSAFIKTPPAWLQVHPAIATPPIQGVDMGEAEAIALAVAIQADALIIDDAAGRAAAKAHGLAVVGLIGVLERAADRDWIDLKSVFGRLVTEMDFRIDKQLLATRIRLHEGRKERR